MHPGAWPGYPIAALGDFRLWLQDEYLEGGGFKGYLDGKVAKAICRPRLHSEPSKRLFRLLSRAGRRRRKGLSFGGPLRRLTKDHRLQEAIKLGLPSHASPNRRRIASSDTPKR